MNSSKARQGAQPASKQSGLLKGLFRPLHDDSFFQAEVEGRLLEFSLGMITPELAEYLLSDGRNQCIRLTKPNWVASLEIMMNEGKFPFTGETVLIGSDTPGGEAVLLDGQHRLSAVKSSGRPMLCLIVSNLPPGTVNFVNVGRPRVPRDMLRGAGYEYCGILSPAAKVVWMLERKMLNLPRDIINYDYKGIVERHDILCHWAKQTANSQGVRFATVAACSYWIYMTKHPEAPRFLEAFLTGLDLHDPNNHAYALRKRIIDDHREQFKGEKGRSLMVLNIFDVWRRFTMSQPPGYAKLPKRVDPTLIDWPGGAPYIDSPLVKGLN